MTMANSELSSILERKADKNHQLKVDNVTFKLNVLTVLEVFVALSVVAAYTFTLYKYGKPVQRKPGPSEAAPVAPVAVELGSDAADNNGQHGAGDGDRKVFLSVNPLQTVGEHERKDTPVE